MSPLEALSHFQLACGELEPTSDEPVLTPIAFSGLPAFDLPEFPYEIASASPAGGDIIPPVVPPVTNAPVTGGPAFPGPIFGTPPIQTPVTTTPVTPVTSVTPVTPVVPEPSSIVLVLTGAGAAIAAGRRRFAGRNR